MMRRAKRMTSLVTAGAMVGSLALLSTEAFAVEGGVEDRKTTFAVSIATGGPGNPQFRCSGSLISSNVVLTVRHCIAPISTTERTCDQFFPAPAGMPTDFWISATPWTLPSTSWKNVRAWTVPEPNAVCGNDIALLILAEPLTEAEAQPAHPVLAAAEFEVHARAKQFGIAGFGATSATTPASGTRHSRFDIPVRCVPGMTGFECSDALSYIDSSEFTGGAGPCIGDSGAGAIPIGDRHRIFGVLSRAERRSGSCSEGVFERTDTWRWLIAKTVLLATPADRTAPSWAKAALPEHPKEGELCVDAGKCDAGQVCVSTDGQRSFACRRRCSTGCDENQRCDHDICMPLESTRTAQRGCSVRSSEGANTLATSESRGGLPFVISVALALWVRVVGRRRAKHS